MRAYSTQGVNATGSATKSILTTVASATVRPRCFQFITGNSQTPADQAWVCALSRFTVAGTSGSTPTITPLDFSDVAAVATAGSAHSGEPTYTAGDLVSLPLNQRATYTWNAWQPGYEIMAPAVAANGFGLRLVSATTALVNNGQLFWYE